VFEKRQQEQDVSHDRNSKNSKLSMNPMQRQTHSPGGALLSSKMPKNLIRRRNDHSPIHQGGMALINTEPINEELESVPAYAQRLKLPVDKRKAERKNTWGSNKEQNPNSRQYAVQP